jgi:hypothetical protein
MAISEGGVITGLSTYAEICSAFCSGGMRGWRYNEWQYNEGTLYILDFIKEVLGIGRVQEKYFGLRLHIILFQNVFALWLFSGIFQIMLF